MLVWSSSQITDCCVGFYARVCVCVCKPMAWVNVVLIQLPKGRQKLLFSSYRLFSETWGHQCQWWRPSGKSDCHRLILDLCLWVCVCAYVGLCVRVCEVYGNAGKAAPQQSDLRLCFWAVAQLDFHCFLCEHCFSYMEFLESSPRKMFWPLQIKPITLFRTTCHWQFE